MGLNLSNCKSKLSHEKGRIPRSRQSVCHLQPENTSYLKLEFTLIFQSLVYKLKKVPPILIKRKYFLIHGESTSHSIKIKTAF